MPTQNADPLARLANELRLTAQQISRRVRFERSSSLAPHQFTVLAKLYRGPMTPGELADIERVSAPSMTRTINGLVDDGYVERTPHATDGRKQICTLTDAGRTLVDQTIADRDDWMLRRLDGLPDADIATLHRAVEILEEVLAR